MVTMKRLFTLFEYLGQLYLKKEFPWVFFEVRHMFELFDIDHIVSWLQYNLVVLSLK